MKKNTINVRELVQKYQANCDRISEIADACEKEQRERTEAENKEFEALTRENQLLGMRMQAATADYLRENPNANAEAEKLIRENLKSGRKTEITLVREGEFAGMMVADATAGGIVPLRVQDFIEPLVEGFILNKVGLPLPTGLSGDFVWPIYDTVEATIAGEGVALTDSKIDLDKLTATPERIGIAIPVTNQSINQSAGIIETLVKKIMPEGVALLLNKIIFGLAPATGATHLVGPFARILQKGANGAPADAARFVSKVAIHMTPTFEDLNAKLKAALLETGVPGNHLCWTMTKSMKAILEGQPINKDGVFIPMIQNDTLCGLPVYTTNQMRKTTGTGAQATVTEYIGLGDYAYQPMGLFGVLRFIVDPYSQARKDAVDFVLNCDYATKTLRPEAFILGEASVANA